MKLHVMFVLTDGSIVTHQRQLAATASVSKALQDIPKDKAVAPHIKKISKAVRVLDGNVFVDDKDKILWLMGVSDNDPSDMNVVQLHTVSKHRGHTVRVH